MIALIFFQIFHFFSLGIAISLVLSIFIFFIYAIFYLIKEKSIMLAILAVLALTYVLSAVLAIGESIVNK